jgi:hypothetical protein
MTPARAGPVDTPSKGQPNERQAGGQAERGRRTTRDVRQSLESLVFENA